MLFTVCCYFVSIETFKRTFQTQCLHDPPHLWYIAHIICTIVNFWTLGSNGRSTDIFYLRQSMNISLSEKIKVLWPEPHLKWKQITFLNSPRGRGNTWTPQHRGNPRPCFNIGFYHAPKFPQLLQLFHCYLQIVTNNTTSCFGCMLAEALRLCHNWSFVFSQGRKVEVHIKIHYIWCFWLNNTVAY